ncbi:MAG: helix-turn-helix domain-containing protein [Candidatus Aminicenantales bacterium]
MTRWKGRFRRSDIPPLELASRRPHHLRQPQTPVRVVERIQELRERYPRWGKDKLAVLLSRKRIKLQASSVGRVMNKLKARGFLVEPAAFGQAKLAQKRRWKPR